MVASKLRKRKTEHFLPVASPGDSSSSGKHLPVAVDGDADASPVQAVESEEDSGSDHSESQAVIAGEAWLSVQPSPISESKTLLDIEKDDENTLVLNADGSTVALNPRLSKKINSIQRKKNREEKLLTEKAIRDARLLPGKVLKDLLKVAGARKHR